MEFEYLSFMKVDIPIYVGIIFLKRRRRRRKKNGVRGEIIADPLMGIKEIKLEGRPMWDELEHIHMQEHGFSPI